MDLTDLEKAALARAIEARCHEIDLSEQVGATTSTHAEDRPVLEGLVDKLDLLADLHFGD